MVTGIGRFCYEHRRTVLVMWVLLMEALRRTGGWSLLLSVLPFTVYPLFAEQSWLGPLRGTQSTLEQATAYHVLSTESLLGIPIQAFADTVIGFLVFAEVPDAVTLTGAAVICGAGLYVWHRERMVRARAA